MTLTSPEEKLRLLLHTGQALTLAQVQQTTGIGERQVRRLLQKLIRQGLPIQQRRYGRQKCIFLPADRQQVALSDIQFDAAELRALAIAAKASRSILIGTPHSQALGRAFDKLLEKARPVTYVFDLDEPMQEWYFEQERADVIAQDAFRDLEQAMDERCSVRIDYQTGGTGQFSKGRKIDPYCFALRKQAWMLVAYCHQRQDIRTFAVNRISQVRFCEPVQETAYFEVKPEFDAETFFNASLGAITEGECFVLRLLVEPDRALFFRQRKYHPTQLIEEDRSDGRLVVSYELEGFEEMRSFCQGWGIGITVLEPESLRRRLMQEAQELQQRYQHG